MRLIILLLSLCLSLPAMADWQVKAGTSSVSFISIKKEHIVENHTFKSFDGSLSKKGNLSLMIDLTSVDTNIGLRDDRIQEFLFETSIYPKATFNADIVLNELTKLAVGDSIELTVDGEINLHGTKKLANVSVLVSKLTNDKILVASTQALLIHAKDFDLVSGILKLKQLAGLSSIGQTVPVNFVLMFEQTK